MWVGPALFSHQSLHFSNCMETYLCGGNFFLNSCMNWFSFIVQRCSIGSYRCESETLAKCPHSSCGAGNNFVGFLKLRSLEEDLR